MKNPFLLLALSLSISATAYAGGNNYPADDTVITEQQVSACDQVAGADIVLTAPAELHVTTEAPVPVVHHASFLEFFYRAECCGGQGGWSMPFLRSSTFYFGTALLALGLFAYRRSPLRSLRRSNMATA